MTKSCLPLRPGRDAGSAAAVGATIDNWLLSEGAFVRASVTHVLDVGARRQVPQRA